MSDLHVLPIGDAIAHLELRQCWCRPTVDESGADAVVVHHSADGREYFEPDSEPTPERPS